MQIGILCQRRLLIAKSRSALAVSAFLNAKNPG